MTIEPRLVEAMRAQLRHRRAVLDEGARHLGWKLGMGDRESVGGHIAVGYLTSATLLTPGEPYAAPPGAALHVDAEACAQLGGPEEIVAYGVAIEIVDLAPLPGEPESVVASNVFHRAVCLGSFSNREPVGATVILRVGGLERARGQWPGDIGERMARAAEVLDAAGERLAAGDLAITGSIVQVPVAIGDHVAAAVGDDAPVTVQIV